MKKTKIMASFLSLTLSMTSFAVTPISVSAETGEPTEIVTTAPTNATTSVITTTSGPVEPVKTTVTESTTAVTTTESVTTECSYSFNIKFTDEDDEPVENIDAKLVQQPIKWTDDEHFVNDGDAKIVAEWNTSDANPFISEVLTANFTEYNYTVVTDELPDGYVYYSSNKVEHGISGYLDGVVTIPIKLKKGEITENTTPLSGTYSLKINVMDIVRNIPVEGLDCELFNIQTGDVAAKWNTSETAEMYIENLEYSFDKPDSYNGNITYAIRITNLPENYRFFYGKTREQYGVSGFSLEEFKNGTDISCTVYLEDTSDDAPKYTYVTTPQAGTAVTETTTTTAEIGTSTTPIVTENNENNEDLDIIFKDNELNIDNGTEKAFEYEITGTNDVSFLSDSTGITVSNTFENGKGTLTVKAKGALEGKNFIKCFLGTGENSITKTITITVNKPTTFHCPECGRDVPIEDKVSGALRAVCKDCYEKGQGIGSTVPPETSKTVTTTSTTVTSTTAEPVKGDANCDGEVNMSDAVLIMQSLANPAKYGVNGTDEHHITEQGKKNADIAGENDGITNADALAIQKKLLKLD